MSNVDRPSHLYASRTIDRVFGDWDLEYEHGLWHLCLSCYAQRVLNEYPEPYDRSSIECLASKVTGLKLFQREHTIATRQTRTNDTKISKFLSLILRHQPELVGLELDAQGWTDVDQLIAKSRAHGQSFDRDTLLRVVAQNDKQRFTLSEDSRQIRAAQGHSINVALGYQPCQPPPLLYHGTASRFLQAIRRQGLTPKSRQQVHLSAERDTAMKVGQRHGKPVILTIDCLGMVADGHRFFLADNGVWLTNRVPPPISS